MAAVFAHIARQHIAAYPDAYRAEIEDVIQLWRPEAWARAQATA